MNTQGPKARMDRRKRETVAAPLSVEPTLALLDAIESGRKYTQRNLSTRVGVALGSIEARSERCVKKGPVKVRQAPAKRYAYYLTARGFRGKSHHVSNHLKSSLKIFRQARLEHSEIFAQCQQPGWNDLAIRGVSGQAGIAIISPLGMIFFLTASFPAARGERKAGCSIPRPVPRGDTSEVPFDQVIAFTQGAVALHPGCGSPMQNPRRAPWRRQFEKQQPNGSHRE